ncbi:MAG TPA: chromate transporter, partial [Bryobacteraceae bacterium]|nr:chromate transporter [Bryobacteraceae bacterium]
FDQWADDTVGVMPQASLKRLTWIFLRVGNLTFGGGDPTMAALQSELVLKRRWLDVEQYALIYGLARITPGTNLVAFSAAAAWQILGWPAAVLAVLAMTVPPSAVVVMLTSGYQSWNSNPLAMAAIGGSIAAASGMMATSAWQLLAPEIRPGRWLRAGVIFVASLVASLVYSMSPIAVLGLAALVGFLWQAAE